MRVNLAELSRSTHLKKDLMCDDLDTVEMTMELEDAFGLAIPDEDADKWQTVGEMSDYVAARLKAPR